MKLFIYDKNGLWFQYKNSEYTFVKNFFRHQPFIFLKDPKYTEYI